MDDSQGEITEPLPRSAAAAEESAPPEQGAASPEHGAPPEPGAAPPEGAASPEGAAPPEDPLRPEPRAPERTRTISVRVPEPQRPDPGAPRAVGRRRAQTLAAFAQALLPPGGDIPYSASDLGVAERIDAAAAGFEAGARRRLARALRAWEWQSLLSRNVRPFSRLPPHAAVGTVSRAAGSSWGSRREAFALLKALCLDAWASTPPVEQATGFTYACLSTTEPQQAPRLEVVAYPMVDRDHIEECDVVVVGSGGGGAVVAKELAEAGLSVVILEEGGSFGRADFAGPPRQRVLRLYREQGLAATTGRPSVALRMGRAVGGSTVVGAGIMQRAPDEVLGVWGSEHGIEGVDSESMQPWFERVERLQHVQPVPEEILGENARALRRGAEQIGLEGDAVRRGISGCRGCGVCTFGCPSDAQQSAHLTYLPRAQRHGAGIYAHCRVERVLVRDGRAAGVVASMLDPDSGEARARLTVRAKVVVLAAGAVHTPGLLAASALGNRSGRLGRNLSLQPRARVIAEFGDAIHGWRGTQRAYAVDQWRAEHGLVIEASAVIPGASGWDLPGSGAALKELLSHARRLAGADVMVADQSRGSVHAGRDGSASVRYRLGREDARRLVRGISYAAETFLAAGARRVLTGLPALPEVTSRADLEQLRDASPAMLRLSAEHPAGTAAMGADPAESVTDAWGAVHDVEGLIVADASLLPGPATVPPLLTVMALATRAADHLVRHRAALLA